MCLGMPGSVVETVNLERQSLLVDVQGQRQQVSAALLIDDTDLPQVGDWVLVHMGFALSRMDEAEARSVLASLDEISDMFADQLQASANPIRETFR